MFRHRTCLLPTPYALLPMKIAFDITVLYIAGAGIFYYRYNLLRAMLSAGHNFVLLDYAPIPNTWARNNPSEVDTLLTFEAELRRVAGLKHRRLAHMSIVHKLKLLALARQFDAWLEPVWEQALYQAMHWRLRTHLNDATVFHSSAVLQSALPGAKNVITIYDVTPLLFPQYHMMQVRRDQTRNFWFAKTQADIIFAISEHTRHDIITHLHVDPARVHVVYGGVDPMYQPLAAETVRQQLAPFGLTPQGYLLVVGTIEPRKNLVRLLEAYHQARQMLPHDVPPLVHVGAKGWFYEDVFKTVQRLNLEEHVTFLGRVDLEALPALYNGARLFLYPSLYEGFGLPVVEAMACQTPVITSNVASLPEVGGDAALLIDPHNTPRIAEAITTLLTDPAQCELMRQRGLVHARQFSWDAAAQKTLAIYEQG